jgi:para-aminobenzoate synthetase / 4-amino-4-deoxychorismate lyase
MKPFALLDDADASPERPTSRLYTGFVREHRCVDPAALDAVCAAALADLAAGLHAVLLADYEWGARLLRAGHAKLPQDDRSCLRLLMFERLEHLDAEGCALWLARQEGRSTPAPAGVMALQPAVTREDFEAAIARIHEAICDGETYQVNYTYRMRGHAWGAPLALYRRLRARQRVGFGALMRLPLAPGDDVEWVLSRSPELFVRHERGRLQARPMKGTAARSRAPEGDSETARLLHEDTKNRAENLMIVDLLRNDLGRISEIGSVKVPELFRVEPYATVFQMTSTIEARRRDDIGLADLLRALFPCGSITGAPKHRTMEWIAALESGPRGLYTGAIGWIDRGDGRCPDLALSVAIRTVTLGPPERAAGARNGLRPLTLGVGGGIVHDSVAADEYEETLWKARFLTALDPGLELFETMRATRRRGIDQRARHRARLAASARVLGFAFDPQAFDALLDRALAQLPAAVPADQPWRLRVALRFDGEFVLTLGTLSPLPPGPVRVLLAEASLGPARPLSVHKTSCRADYDAGVRAAEAAGAFDTLFFGPHDELLEGGRSNVFLRLGGQWLTPPLADGVLPGVMRAVLLDDPAWNARECRLKRADLGRAEAVVVCNALRGALPATVVEAVQGVSM